MYEKSEKITYLRRRIGSKLHFWGHYYKMAYYLKHSADVTVLRIFFNVAQINSERGRVIFYFDYNEHHQRRVYYIKIMLINQSLSKVQVYTGPTPSHKASVDCIKRVHLRKKRIARINRAFIAGQNLLRVCKARTARVIALAIAKRAILVPFVFVVPFPNLNNRW